MTPTTGRRRAPVTVSPDYPRHRRGAPTEAPTGTPQAMSGTTPQEEIMLASKTLLFLAITGVSSASFAAAAEDTPPAPAVFVKKAAQDGMTEVQLGQIALDKSQNEDVRNFAQRMVTDHGKAND